MEARVGQPHLRDPSSHRAAEQTDEDLVDDQWRDQLRIRGPVHGWHA
jgi:hypothetical protein